MTVTQEHTEELERIKIELEAVRAGRDKLAATNDELIEALREARDRRVSDWLEALAWLSVLMLLWLMVLGVVPGSRLTIAVCIVFVLVAFVAAAVGGGEQA